MTPKNLCQEHDELRLKYFDSNLLDISDIFLIEGKFANMFTWLGSAESTKKWPGFSRKVDKYLSLWWNSSTTMTVVTPGSYGSIALAASAPPQNFVPIKNGRHLTYIIQTHRVRRLILPTKNHFCKVMTCTILLWMWLFRVNSYQK